MEMQPQGANEPRVTLVVTPRERFGVARSSFESIVNHTKIPFDLVYVDANGPASIAEWAAPEMARHGFTYIRRDYYVGTNEARNLGLAAAKTPYVVFIENDVIVTPGWLQALVACADETGAALVSPLIFEGDPKNNMVHQAGGRFADDPAAFFKAARGTRSFRDTMLGNSMPLADCADLISRRETQVCEFHCVLVRRDFLTAIGGLDPKMLATREHIDLAITAAERGEKAMFEPSSRVTYYFPTRAYPITEEDIPFFSIRWSIQWQRRSLEYFRDKWGFRAGEERLDPPTNHLRWRHDQGIILPQLRKVPVIGRNRTGGKVMKRFVWPVHDVIVARHIAREETRRQKATIAT